MRPHTSSLSANEVEDFLLPWEREKVPGGRMRVVRGKTNPAAGERWRVSLISSSSPLGPAFSPLERGEGDGSKIQTHPQFPQNIFYFRE